MTKGYLRIDEVDAYLRDGGSLDELLIAVEPSDSGIPKWSGMLSKEYYEKEDYLKER